MRQRVVMFAVAFLVAAAPAALTACEILCAAHALHLASEGITHSCHTVQRSDASVVGSDGHVCGHESNMPATARPGLQTAPAPAIDVALFSGAARADDVDRRIDVPAVISPGSSNSPAPLRI